MAGREHIKIRTNTSLDFPLETKVGPWGPFSGGEFIMVFMVPLVLGGLCAVIWKPLICTIVIWYWAFPRWLMSQKKNKPRSWLWDFFHRIGFGMDSQLHFRRPLVRQVYVGSRGLAKGPFVNAKRCGFAPFKPIHLVLGLPMIRIYDPGASRWRRSITPQPRTGGLAVMDRVYRINSRRLPAHKRFAILGADANGRPLHGHECDGFVSACHFTEISTPWKPKPSHA